MKRSARSRKRSFTALALACALCAGTFAMVHADALYILTGAGDETVLLDETAEAPDFSSQMVYVGSGANGYELTLKAGRPVRIQYGNTILGTTAQGETVSELLARFDIIPGPLDGVLVDIGESRITLTVGSDLTYYEARTAPRATRPSASPRPTCSRGRKRWSRPARSASPPISTRWSGPTATSSILRFISRWNRKSRLVTMPIKCSSGATTGIPPILFSFINASASPTVSYWK